MDNRFSISDAPVSNPGSSSYKLRAPAELPPVKDGEELFEYVTSIKEDAPISYFTVLGINFEKSVLPAEFSYVGNEMKRYFPRMLAKRFTKAQIEAVQKRLHELEIVIAPRFNHDRKDANDPEFFPGEQFFASDVAIFLPLSSVSYNLKPVTPEELAERIQSAEPKEEKKIASPEEVRDELYKQQKSRKDK